MSEGREKDVNDFDACDDFFRIVFDGYVIAYYMHKKVGESTTQLNKHFEGSDWPESIWKATEHLKGPFQMLNMRDASAEIEAAVEEGVEAKRGECREYLVGRKREKQRTGVPNPEITNRPKWSEVEAEVTRKLTAKDRDIVQENAILFLNCAMIYLDFHEVCRYGFSGRVEQCIRFFAVMFAGSKFANYAAECMHLVTCLTHTRKHQFKKAWMDYCLINLNARPGIYCAADRHGEAIIRENKDKVCNACNGFQGRD